MEGRFAQVAGVTYGFDPSKPSGSRVDKKFIRVQGEYLDNDKVGKCDCILGREDYNTPVS